MYVSHVHRDWKRVPTPSWSTSVSRNPVLEHGKVSHSCTPENSKNTCSVRNRWAKEVERFLRSKKNRTKSTMVRRIYETVDIRKEIKANNDNCPKISVKNL
ncbi:hypothetical protein J6590_085243 [Homalodisca vitripennis]|nr:hypothetical protein J6590_085243 [Homalodisca vitripennis]